MLSVKEKAVLKYIIESSASKTTCLLSPLDIIHGVAPKHNISNIELQGILDGLAQDNYIELVNSDKNGELIYCISINSKGKSFIREQRKERKVWTSAIIRTIVLAIISFVVGLILKALFT